MKIFLLGATGQTGRLVLEEGLSRGHEFTAVVRPGSNLSPRDHLRVITGDPLQPDDLVLSVAGNDVVISCLGQRSGRDSHLLRDAAGSTLDAMARAGVRRYIAISQGLLFPSRNPLNVLLRLILARHVADSTDMEREVQGRDVVWTIVRPPRLVQSSRRVGYRASAGSRSNGGWSMPYADLAAFLVDEAERGKYPNTIVGVAAA